MDGKYNQNLLHLSNEYMKANELYPFLLPQGYVSEMQIIPVTEYMLCVVSILNSLIFYCSKRKRL